MQRHFGALVAGYSFILVGFVFGLAFDSIALALASLVSGLVAAFVMAVALLRADGHSPEHHAHVNRVLDDVNS
jgi:hypothetical protein